MRAFLETYGKNIFILIIVTIMVLLAFNIGRKVESNIHDEVKLSTDILQEKGNIAEEVVKPDNPPKPIPEPKPEPEPEPDIEEEDPIQGDAFAIYSATDNSLTFYGEGDIPSVGDTYNDKKVTTVYRDIETTNYGGSVQPDWFKDGKYSAIKKVEFNGKVSPMSTYYWFCSFSQIKTLDLTNLDTSKTTNMDYMFYYCQNLKEVNISKLKTSNVTSMIQMFYYCVNLESIDVSNWKTTNVESMYGMFQGCSKLSELNLNNFNTSKVKSMYSMFYGCSNLKTIKLSKWDTSNLVNMDYMFNGCSNLTEAKVDNFNTSKVTNMYSTFGDCQLLSTNCENWDVANVANNTNFNTGAPNVKIPKAWN